MTSARRAQAWQRLLALGAGEFAHVSGSLATHLHGTETLLRRWGSREALCLAGLYHAVYGTDGIVGSLTSVGARKRIAELIGEEAERIAYLYGACARDAFHPRIGAPDELRFADRFIGAEYPIDPSLLRDFCELTVANELELAFGNGPFRAKHRASLRDLFDRMAPHLSEPARTAYRRRLG
jgi:uncharacterized protein DUF6817